MGGLTFPHGYFDGEWQKVPIPFGYSDGLSDKVINTNLAAGANTLDGLVVPDGQIWVITNIAMQYIGTVTTTEMYARFGGTPDSILWGVARPQNNYPYDRQGQWVLNSGNFMRLQVFNATVGDDAYFYYSGYKIDMNL